MEWIDGIYVTGPVMPSLESNYIRRVRKQRTILKYKRELKEFSGSFSKWSETQLKTIDAFEKWSKQCSIIVKYNCPLV